MIEGLKLDFSTEELNTHLGARIDHHRERVEFYRRQVAALRAGGAEAQEYTGGDPVRSLSDSMDKHRNRADLLEVMRTHLVPDETYRLDENDLLKLELLAGRLW